MTSALWAVLPGSIDDPAAPSGGNRYDRAVLSLLSGAGVPGAPVRRHPPGKGPQDLPGTAVRTDPRSNGAGSGFLPVRDVHEIAIPGSWPRPGAPARHALRRALHEIPDKSVVLLDGLVGCGVPDLLEAHRDRLHLAVLVHLPLSDETGLDEATAAELQAREGAALRMAGTVIATSDAAARRITDMHGLSDVHVAVPGVDPAPPAVPDPAGRRLLCVASVTPRKGQDLLVTALESYLADLDWTCTFVGALVTPVAHTSSAIHFAGPKSGAALDDAYAAADLFVLPSRAETYGMVVTEALARGIPVLATAVGGVPEALGHAPDGTRPGLLVPPQDPAALAAALRSWLTGAALRDRLRAAAHARRATLPTWTETALRLSEVLPR